jgi:hypothetical protein
MAPRAIALWSAMLAAGLPSLQAQTYSAKQLDCARFREVSQSRILTLSAGRNREQSSGRSAVWLFRAAPGDSGVALEGWLDSLSLWRRSAESTIRPDSEGLLGGRYRGTLSPTGAYSGRVVPFIPDEVAEMAGMATALDDFFAPLPVASLRPGQVWTRPGVSIRRLADSALSGVLLRRFQVDMKGETRRTDTLQDTLGVELRESSRERGTFVWHPTLGLIRRERKIVIDATVPRSRTVRQAIHTRVEQSITLARDLSPRESSRECAG